METMPLISVIVPVYNAGAYLEECLESITGQTYGNLEVILVDDGSTDGSLAVCDEFAERDGRIRVIHQENRGAAAARRTGVLEAEETISVLWMQMTGLTLRWLLSLWRI